MANPLICLQSDAPQGGRRVTRQPIVFQRPRGQQHAAPGAGLIGAQQKEKEPVLPSKTKGALCFLCLFDGLRTPTIRRLSRKPRTICNKPLLTFDPTVFAPASQNAIQDLYLTQLKCSSEMVVDPPVKDAVEMIRRVGQTGPPDRVIIHYYGQGCNQPSADGSIFFFSDDRLRYKPIKIDVLRKNCVGPICAIIDSPNAAALAPYFNQPETIAFFACSQNEQLPISTDAPWDLFSSCLLAPFTTALWWHSRRHSCVFDIPENFAESQESFIKQFFFALLEAIAFDTQPKEVLDVFARDPAMLSLARGFVLAQRIMQSFNLHPVSHPQLKPTSSHDLWFFWDTAIDCALSMPEKEASRMIFKLFISSFSSFPNLGMLPLFSFFISRADFCNDTVTTLLKYIDAHPEFTEVVARSSIAKTIVELRSPSESTLLLLCKILASGPSQSPFGQTWPFWFGEDGNPESIKAGFLSICIAIQANCSSSFTKIAPLCIQKAKECAPYSAILLGQLLKNAQRLWNLPSFSNDFVPLLTAQSEEDRAAGAYILGLTKDKSLIQQLIPILSDQSPLVRAQAVVALGTINQTVRDPSVQSALDGAKKDQDANVADLAKLITEGRLDQAQKKADLLAVILKAVKGNNFIDAYKKGLLK